MNEPWHSLFFPLARLLLGLAAGLFLAQILECLRLTDWLAKIAQPLARLAHLGPAAAAAFALAFISPMAANGLLSEKYAQCEINSRELLLANLFNGLPASFTHMRTILFLLWPVLGLTAFVYVGLNLLAAACRTLFTILLGHWLLPKTNRQAPERGKAPRERWPTRLRPAFKKALMLFCKRLPKLALFTAPVYVLVYFCQQYGMFEAAETWLAEHLSWLPLVKPQAMGIIILEIVAETGATLGAAGAIMEDGGLSAREIVMALLIGNVLATPLRAIRHQFPAYAGYFKPVMALKLVLANQSLRLASMVGAIWLYAWLA